MIHGSCSNIYPEVFTSMYHGCGFPVRDDVLYTAVHQLTHVQFHVHLGLEALRRSNFQSPHIAHLASEWDTERLK